MWEVEPGNRRLRKKNGVGKKKQQTNGCERGAWSDSRVKGLQSVWVWVGERRWRGLVMLFVVR
jgi:hypothetical protein